MTISKLAAALVSLALLAATAATAATATYKITKIDAATKTITLGNNQTYTFPSDFKLDDYKVGDLVRVTYSSEGGKNSATAIGKL